MIFHMVRVNRHLVNNLNFKVVSIMESNRVKAFIENLMILSIKETFQTIFLKGMER